MMTWKVLLPRAGLGSVRRMWCGQAAAAWANGGSLGGRRQRAAQPLPARPLAAPLPEGVELFEPAGQQQQQQQGPGGTYQHAGSTGVRGHLPAAPQPPAQPRPQPGQPQGRGQRGGGAGCISGSAGFGVSCTCSGRLRRSWGHHAAYWALRGHRGWQAERPI
jgi:hypothetical protein